MDTPQRPPSQRVIIQQPQSSSSKVEDLLTCLKEGSHRLGHKVTVLTKFIENLEEMINTPSYASYQGEIYEALIGDLQKTQPHFIAENETQQLRKAIIQLFLRLPMTDMVKRVSHKNGLIKELFNIVCQDNEENAVLALKVLNEQLKVNRLNPQELPAFFEHFKKAYSNFLRAAEENKEMFLARPVSEVTNIEEEVTRSLPRLYYTKALHLRRADNEGASFQYTLIPQASMSVKVFSEIPPLFMQLYQVTRQVQEGMFNVLVNYIAVTVPRNVDDIAMDTRGNASPPALNAPLIDEFHNSQVRAMYFLAWTVKQQRTQVPITKPMATQLTQAMGKLLESLNPYVTTARREFIAAVKTLLTGEFKSFFVGIVPTLTCERFVLGESFSSQDFLRNVVYSQLADILHHIRFDVSYPVVIHLFNLCVRCLHDTQLVAHNQTMYGKLLMNLCDPLLNQEKEKRLPARETFLYALEAFVKKTKTLADHIIPQSIQAEVSKRDASQFNQREQPDQSQDVQNIGSPRKQPQQQTQTNAYSVHWQEQTLPLAPHECRNMIRFTINPVKILAVALNSCHLTEDSSSFSDERELFHEFFIHGISCLQQFVALVNQVSQNNQYAAQLKIFKKDEKECIEMFSSIFTDGHPQVFEYIMSKNVEFLIDAIVVSKPLQDIANHFLAQQRTSTIMGSILIKFLIGRMNEIGQMTDKSKVYSSLFHQVFRTVSTDQSISQENMLMPFLHEIIAEALQVALRSREPWHYFQLLRYLFRSIGTGAHDQLYREFLPLLPSILQQLNRFQNGSHRQQIHDVFVELCLTVPVRLSSLLPYLALLMDPLVCALHGSTSLVQQGLRTLELCVDNLQPDYFFDHMETVRASLMQGLWRSLYTQDTSSATSALRIMAKLGGSSRRAFLDAQVYEFIDESDRSLSLNSLKLASYPIGGSDAIKLTINTVADVGGSELHMSQAERGLKRRNEEDIPKELKELTMNISAAQMVEAAVAMIKSAQINEHQPALSVNWAHWQSGFNVTSSQRLPKAHALEVCRTVLYTVIQTNPIHRLNKEQKRDLCQKAFSKWSRTEKRNTVYRCSDARSRTVFGSGLTGIFYGIVASESREIALPFFSAVVVHLTTQSLLDSMDDKTNATEMDGFILIDVIVKVLSDSCKEFAYAGLIALSYIKLTVSYLFASSDLSKASQLTFFSELLEQIRLLCYRREWYAKLGGCTALRFFIENFPREFVVPRASELFDALLTTISCVADEISSGAVDVASKCLDIFVGICFPSPDFDETLLDLILSHLLLRFLDPEPSLRHEAFRVLDRLTDATNLSAERLLERKTPELKQCLLKGFNEFSTMTSFSHVAFLEFVNRFLLDAKLYDSEYPRQSVQFISNLQLIVSNTDVALNAMPSCRYATANMNRGSHSLEAQLKNVKEQSFKVLMTHTKVLIKLKKTFVQDEHTSKMEKLGVILQSIDMKKVEKIDGNAVEVLIKTAMKLADIDLPDMELEDDRVEEHVTELKKKLETYRTEQTSEEDRERILITSFLDEIVKFFLKLATHPTHPFQKGACDILQTVFVDEPAFSMYVHAELNHQIGLIRPLITLNQTVGHMKDAGEKLKFLDTSDRFKLSKHFFDTPNPTSASASHTPWNKELKKRTNLNIDLDGEESVESLFKGPVSFKLKNETGKVLATGRIVGFAPVITRDEKPDKNIDTIQGELEAIYGLKPLEPNSLEAVKKLKAIDNTRPGYEYLDEDNLDQAVEDFNNDDILPEVKADGPNVVVFVVADRKENEFVFKRYLGQIPPKFGGTFITFTRLPSGELLRSIRNYGQTKIDQRIDYLAETELERQFGNSACSMIFDEIDETTAAHLTEVANMLMLEAQSLGLDKPSYTVTLRSVPRDNEVPEEVEEQGLHDMDMFGDIDDQALQDIGNALLKDMPDGAFFNESSGSGESVNPPAPQSQASQSQELKKQSEETSADSPMPDEAPVQTDIDPKDGLDAGYIRQIETNQNQEKETSQDNKIESDRPGKSERKESAENGDEPMDTESQEEEERARIEEKAKEVKTENFMILRTDAKWSKPVVCHIPVDRDHKAHFEHAHIAVDESLRLIEESTETADDRLAGQFDDNPVAQHPSETFDPVFIGRVNAKQKRVPGRKRVSLDEKILTDTDFDRLLDETERVDGLNAEDSVNQVVKKKKIKLRIEGAEKIDINKIVLPDEIIDNISDPLVIGLNETSLKSDKENEDSQILTSGPYDYITDKKLRQFLNNVHKSSPENARKAMKYYTKRLSAAIKRDYIPTLPVDPDGVLRIQFAAESVLLSNGTAIQTLPRTIFNYLSNEIFEEVKDFDRLNREVIDSLKSAMLNKDLFDFNHEEPDSDDEIETIDPTEDFLTARKLKIFSDLREMVNAGIPTKLIFYICGEVGAQVFQKDINKITEDDLSLLYYVLNLLSSVDCAVVDQLFPFMINSISFLSGIIEFLNLSNQELFQDVISKLVKCLIKIPKKVVNLLLSYTLLSQRITGIFVNELLKVDQAEVLRAAILKEHKRMETLLYGEPIEDDSDEFVHYSPELGGRQRLVMDTTIFTFLHTISVKSNQEFGNAHDLMTILMRFWRSDDMRRRYTIRDGHAPSVGSQVLTNSLAVDSKSICSSTGDMIKVPEMVIRVFMEYMTLHPERIDVLYFSCYAFSHKFVTDFTFFKKYIDESIIPMADMEWRHNAFAKLIEFFKPRRSQFGVTESEVLARFIQYVVTPTFVYAFNKYPIDDVVGCEPNPEQQNEKSIVWQFCLYVIEPYNKQFPVPDLLKITLYQFCALLVQKCPIHIHDNKKQKKQGECLRLFMLFGWPCLQAQHQGDPIEKYAGQYLIANLMEEFSIAKRIVLQALTALVCAHQQELREVVKKSLEIIIPSMPTRMEDGDQQVVTVLKKSIDEPTTSQIVHCITIAARHYKVLFNLRCTVAKMMNSAVQRLLTQNANETKKVALDMCETCIKWEQHRQKMLETVKTAEQSGNPVPKAFNQPKPFIDVTVDNLRESFDQTVIDSIFTILLRFATSLEQPVNQTVDQNVRRALMLLRLAVKPHIFGESRMKLVLLEKPFIDFSQLQPELQQQSSRINIVVGAIEVITTIISGLSGDALRSILGKLEKYLAECFSYPYLQINQAAIKLLTKLVETTEVTVYGIEKFEEINNAVIRYLNNNLMIVLSPTIPISGGTNAQVTVILTILRIFCKANPSFIDAHINNFFKLFSKLAREYSPGLPQTQDRPMECVIICIDIIRPRIANLDTELRRSLIQLLFPLSERLVPERLLDRLLVLTGELIQFDKDVTPIYGVQLLSRMVPIFQKQVHSCNSIFLRFLNVVHTVFNDRELRKSEGGQKLQVAFFWGLGNPDEHTRRSFFQLFESQFPRSLFERIMFIIGEQNWIPMTGTFWVNHCLNVMMKASIPPSNQKTSMSFMKGSLGDSEDITIAGVELASIQKNPENMEVDGEGPKEAQDILNSSHVSNQILWRDSPVAPDTKVTAEQLMEYESQLVSDPPTQLDDFFRSLMEMCYTDPSLCKRVFIDFFVSAWSQMPQDGIQKRVQVASFFLQSGVASTTADLSITPLICFYEAFVRCQPNINIDSHTLEYLAINHKGWYSVLDRMETKFRTIQLARHLMNSTRLYHDDIRLMDSLALLYERLGEHDLLAAMWRKRACLNGTIEAIQLFYQGMYREARIQSRLAIKKGRELFSQDSLTDPTQQATVTSTAPFYDIRVVDIELRKLEEIWLQSCVEMGDWRTLLQFVNNPDVANSEILAEAAWHQGEWKLVRSIANQIEATGQKEHVAKASLYRTMCNITEFQLNQNKKLLEYSQADLSAIMIAEWRQLPPITSEAHMEVLRKAQLIQEISESGSVGLAACDKMITTRDLENTSTPRHTETHIQFHVDNSMVNEIKQFIKTWRCRAASVSVDPLSHWSAAFSWRIQQYFNVMKIFDGADQTSVPHQGQMQPLHSIAQTQITFARMYRKAELYEESLQQLAQLHSMAKLYRIDGCMKIIEEVKCLLSLADRMKRVIEYGERCVDEGKVNVLYGITSYLPLLNSNNPMDLVERALDLVDEVNPSLFPKELAARLFTLRAQLLSILGKEADADRIFSVAAQLAEDSPVLPVALNGQTVWKYWAIHLEQKFSARIKRIKTEGTSDELHKETRAIGVETLTSLLEVLRTVSEMKARKYMARFFHVYKSLTALDIQIGSEKLKQMRDEATEEEQLFLIPLDEIIDNQTSNIPLAMWLFWLDQIITEVANRASKGMANLLRKIADAYPQPTLLAMRTALSSEVITLKIDDLQRRLPLISDWMRCAPALDERENKLSNGNKTVKESDDEFIEVSEETTADEEYLRRKRDDALKVAIKNLIILEKQLKLEKDQEKKEKFLEIRKIVTQRVCLLQYLKRKNLIPKVKKLKKLREFKVESTVEKEFEIMELEDSESEKEEDGFVKIKLPSVDSTQPVDILLDTQKLAKENYDIDIELFDDFTGADFSQFKVDCKESTETEEEAMSMLLSVVDSVCVDRYADIRALNQILNELDEFPESWAEQVYEKLLEIVSIVNLALSQLKDDDSAEVMPISETIKERFLQLSETFGGIQPFKAEINELEVELKTKITVELGKMSENHWNLSLHDAKSSLSEWLEPLEVHLKTMEGLVFLKDISPFLSSFNGKLAQVDIPSMWIPTRNCLHSSLIAHFLPTCNRVFRGNGIAYIVSILSQNGKIFSYLLQRQKPNKAMNRWSQLLIMLNSELQKHREMCRRQLHLPVAFRLQTGSRRVMTEVYPLSSAAAFPQTEIDRSINTLWPLSTLALKCLERSLPTSRLWTQSSPDVSKTELTDWMRDHYPDTSTFWIVRKKLTQQWGLLMAMELAFGLGEIDLDKTFIGLYTAQLYVTEAKMKVKMENDKFFLDLKENSLRLSPNISEFFQTDHLNEAVFLSGHLSGSFISACRFMSTSKTIPLIIRVLLWDQLEELSSNEWRKKTVQFEALDFCNEKPMEMMDTLSRIAQFKTGQFKALDSVIEAAKGRNQPPKNLSWF